MLSTPVDVEAISLRAYVASPAGGGYARTTTLTFEDGTKEVIKGMSSVNAVAEYGITDSPRAAVVSIANTIEEGGANPAGTSRVFRHYETRIKAAGLARVPLCK